MKDFKDYLNKTSEVGYVEETLGDFIRVSGLPKARVTELVLFESGEKGQVFSLDKEYVEVLLLSESDVRVGTRVARTDQLAGVRVGEWMLGKVIDSLGNTSLLEGSSSDSAKGNPSKLEYRDIDIPAPGMASRISIERPYESGVSIVDLVVPLGMGQRELVVGDRKTGKTEFLLQNLLSQARKGTICIYSAIAKSRIDILKIHKFTIDSQISSQVVIVATSSAEPAGMIFNNPYVAMTIAEYFRDQGKDVLLVLDDMTAHATHYRKLSLLAKRFPGRSSYPGDIFYLHSRLLERAGNFVVSQKDASGKVDRKEVAITCLPVAELVMGDLSGYIQTNLMSMTDGHIYFDIDYFNQGRRPAVNPFLSVTRVGRQAQTPLLRDISKNVTSFLVNVEEMKQFMHFGAELTQKTKDILATGEKLQVFLNQPNDKIVDVEFDILVIGLLWSGQWRDSSINDMKMQLAKLGESYTSDERTKNQIASLIQNSQDMAQLVDNIKSLKDFFQSVIGVQRNT